MPESIPITPPSESEKPDAVLLGLEAFLEAKLPHVEMARAYEKMEATADRQIVEIPAQSFAGIAVKLRALCGSHSDPDPRTVPFEDRNWDQILLVCALEDAERLAGGAA